MVTIGVIGKNRMVEHQIGMRMQMLRITVLFLLMLIILMLLMQYLMLRTRNGLNLMILMVLGKTLLKQ